MNYCGASQPGIDTRADLHNGSGGFGTGNQRQPDRIRLPGTMLQVDVINPDPLITHDNVAGRGHWIRTLNQYELVGSAMTRDLNCEHS